MPEEQRGRDGCFAALRKRRYLEHTAKAQGPGPASGRRWGTRSPAPTGLAAPSRCRAGQEAGSARTPGEQCVCGAAPHRDPRRFPGTRKNKPEQPRARSQEPEDAEAGERAERGGSHGGRRAHPARPAPLPLRPARPAAPPAAAPAHLQQHQEGGEAPLPAAELPGRPEGLLQPQRHGPPAALSWRPRPAPPAGPEPPAARPGTGGTSPALEGFLNSAGKKSSRSSTVRAEHRTRERGREQHHRCSRRERLPRHKVARGRIHGDMAAFLPQKSTQSRAAGVTPGDSRTAQQLLRSCVKWEQLSSFHDRDFKRHRISHQHLI